MEIMILFRSLIIAITMLFLFQNSVESEHSGCCSSCSNYGLVVAVDPSVQIQPIFYDSSKVLYRALINPGTMTFTHRHEYLLGDCHYGICQTLYDQVNLNTVLLNGLYQHNGYSTLLSSAESVVYQWQTIAQGAAACDNIVYGPGGTLPLPKWINGTSMLAIATANDFDCGLATNHVIQRNDLVLANPPANCLNRLKIKSNHGSVTSLEPGLLEIFLDFGQGPGGQSMNGAVHLHGNSFLGLGGVNALQMNHASAGEVRLKQHSNYPSGLYNGEIGILYLDKKVKNKVLRLGDMTVGSVVNLDLNSHLTLTSQSVVIIPAQAPRLVLYDSTLIVEEESNYLTRVQYSKDSDLQYPGVLLENLNCPSGATFLLHAETITDFSGCSFGQLVTEDSEFTVQSADYSGPEANFITPNSESRLVIRDSSFQTANAENYDSIVLDTVGISSGNFVLSHGNVIGNLHNYTPVFETQIRADSITNLRGDIDELLISTDMIFRGVSGNINAFGNNNSSLTLAPFNDGSLTKIKGTLAGFNTIEFHPKSILLGGSIIANSNEVFFNYHNTSREYGTLISFLALPHNVDITGLERCFSSPSAITHLHFSLRDDAIDRDYVLEFTHGPVIISDVDSVHVYTRCPNTNQLAMLYNPEIPHICPAKGSPVRLADGVFLHSSTDLDIPTREKRLSLRREYVSNSGTVSAFGAKWTGEHFIHMQIIGAPESMISVYWSDATATRLLPTPQGIYRSEDGSWSAEASNALTSVMLRHNSGMQYTFQDTRSILSPEVPNMVPVRMEDSGAYALVYSYNDHGLLTSVREELKVSPSSIGNPELLIDYGANNLISQVSFSGRQNIYYEHDQYGRLLAVRNDEGLLEAYQYSDNRFAYSITGIVGPYGETVGLIEYSDLHQVTHFSVYGDTGELEYDELGTFLREIKDRGNDSQTIEVDFVHYYQAQNYKRITGNAIIENRTEYSDARQVLSQQDSLGRHVVMAYDEFGNKVIQNHLIDTPDPQTPYEERLFSQGYTTLTSFVHLPQGSKPSLMISSSPDGENVIIRYTWDGEGRLLSETLGSRRKYLSYNGLGKLERVYLQLVDEHGQVLQSDLIQEMEYDHNGRLASEFSGRYDSNGQKIISLFSWDSWGNLTEKLEGGTKRTTYLYDSLNRPVQETISDTLNQTSPITKNYSWDHAGKLRIWVRPNESCCSITLASSL